MIQKLRGCIRCKNTQRTSFYICYLLVDLLVLQCFQCYWSCQFHWLSSSQFCWFRSSVGPLVLLVWQLCWFTSSTGSLVLLVHQFFWFTSSVGSLVLLVHQFCWFTSSFGSLVLVVHWCCWFASPFGSLVLLVCQFDWFASFVGLFRLIGSLVLIGPFSFTGALVLLFIV